MEPKDRKENFSTSHDMEWSEKTRLFIMLICLPIAMVLGYLGYMEYPVGEKHIPSNAVYHTLQLFLLHAPHFTEPVPMTLQIARFLAPAYTLFAIIGTILFLFKHEFKMWGIKRLKKHTILCGLGEVGIAIARNFENKGKLLIIEKNADNENLEQLRMQGARVISGNALDPEFFKKVGIRNAEAVYATTGTDFDNLTIIRNLKALLLDKKFENKGLKIAANLDSLNFRNAAYQEMSVHVDAAACELQNLLRSLLEIVHKLIDPHLLSIDKEKLIVEYDKIKSDLEKYDPSKDHYRSETDNVVKLFNINELAARYIFRLYPPDNFKPITSKSDPRIHILLMGYSQMGEELFKLYAQNCHYINQKNTKITILHQDSHLTESKILNKHPNITSLLELNFVPLNPHHLNHRNITKYGLSDVDMVYVCSENDISQSSYAAKAREIFGEEMQIVSWFSKNCISAAHCLASGKTFSVNILKSAASTQNIMNETIDCKAIALHNRWIKMEISGFIKKIEKSLFKKQDLPKLKETLLPWHLLDEETRDDNRSVIEHNFIKLRSMGQFLDREFFLSPENAIVNFGFLADEIKVNQLAEMEHRRWMANKYLNAWEYDPKRDKKEKHHNDLKDFDDLDKETKDYDIKQILELKEVWECNNNTC